MDSAAAARAHEEEVQTYVHSQAHLLNKSSYNPLPTELPPPIAALSALGDMHVVVLIGLPEVGKPFLAKRMRQYLRFFHGADCALFDICENLDYPSVDESSAALSARISEWMLRNGGASNVPLGSPLLGDGESAPTYKGQKAVDSGRCAIVYGSDTYRAFEQKWSGSSKERRRWILDQVRAMSRSVKLVFVEVKVTDVTLMRNNVAIKRHAMGLPTCEEDFRRTEASIKEFAKLYVTLQQDGSEEDMSYVIFINYGQKVVTNRMHGFLRMRIAQFLSTIHTETHTIYLTRHGQSQYNQLGKIGGNSGVTEYGLDYARRLATFARETICREDGSNANKARLWTSSMRRTNETAQFIEHPEVTLPDGDKWVQMSHRVYRNLDEIFAGEYEGLTYEEVASRHKDEAFLRKVDKIGYRYPRGESYFDIISRLDPLIHELESYHEPTLIVSHQAVLRMLYAYLMGIDRMDAPRLSIPLHTVIKLTYNGWTQCVEQQVYLGPDVPKDEQST